MIVEKNLSPLAPNSARNRMAIRVHRFVHVYLFSLSNVLVCKCLSKEKSFCARVSLWANVFLGKCLLGKCLSGQMFSGQMSSRQMSFWANILMGKRCLGKCHHGQMLYCKMSLGKTCKPYVVCCTILICEGTACAHVLHVRHARRWQTHIGNSLVRLMIQASSLCRSSWIKFCRQVSHSRNWLHSTYFSLSLSNTHTHTNTNTFKTRV
jgi:hypothetical protein